MGPPQDVSACNSGTDSLSIFHQEPLQCFVGGYRNIADLIEPTRDPQALLQQLQVFLSLHEKGTKTGQVRVHQLSVE